MSFSELCADTQDQGLFLAHELTGTHQPAVSYTTHVHRSRLYFVLIGCSETGTVGARLVLSTGADLRLLRAEFSSLQRLSVSTGDLGLRIEPKSALGLA